MGPRDPGQHPGPRHGPHRTRASALRRRRRAWPPCPAPCRWAASPTRRRSGDACVFLASPTARTSPARPWPSTAAESARRSWRRRGPGRTNPLNRPRRSRMTGICDRTRRHRHRRGTRPRPGARAGLRRRGRAGRRERPRRRASTAPGSRRARRSRWSRRSAQREARPSRTPTTSPPPTAPPPSSPPPSTPTAGSTPSSTTPDSCATACSSTSARTTGTPSCASTSRATSCP